MTLDETLLTRVEAATALGISPKTLGVWACQDNKYGLPYVKVGRSVRYKLSDLNLFVKERTTKTQPKGKSDK